MQKGAWSRLAGGSRRGALIETGPQSRHEDASRSLQERDSRVIKEKIDVYIYIQVHVHVLYANLAYSKLADQPWAHGLFAA